MPDPIIALILLAVLGVLFAFALWSEQPEESAWTGKWTRPEETIEANRAALQRQDRWVYRSIEQQMRREDLQDK